MAVEVYGTKVGMTRIYDGDVAVPVTVIQVEANEVVEVKTDDKHGYQALKVAVGPLKSKNKVSKALAGEYAKADVAPRRFLREVPVVAVAGEGEDAEAVEATAGSKITLDVLTAGEKCDVTGTSKGRGFAGVMKRWNFGGGRASHGSKVHRGGGAIGCRMDPGKVFKNKKMAGHYGAERVTVRNLSIVKVDPENNVVLVRGAVPGPNGGLVSIRQK